MSCHMLDRAYHDQLHFVYKYYYQSKDADFFSRFDGLFAVISKKDLLQPSSP